MLKLFKVSTLNIVKSYDQKSCAGVSKTHCIFYVECEPNFLYKIYCSRRVYNHLQFW